MSYERDMKIQAMAQNVASAGIGTGLYHAGNQIRPESELESITSRVHRLASDIEEIGSKLSQHADALHGDIRQPVPAGTEAAPCRAGQLGALHDALDRLERAHSFVAEQAGRNCTLA